MCRARDEALQIDAAVAERGLRLALRERQLGLELRRIVRDANAAPAAAGGRLDHDRIADARGHVARGVERLHDAVAAGHRRHVRAPRGVACTRLVAHRRDHLRVRADEDEAGRFDLRGECGVFGEEAVARMDRIRAALPCGVEDRGRIQVALRRVRGADVDRFVGHARGEAVAVRIADHGDRAHPELVRGANHAHRDFAAVRDQHGADARRAIERVAGNCPIHRVTPRSASAPAPRRRARRLRRAARRRAPAPPTRSR